VSFIDKRQVIDPNRLPEFSSLQLPTSRSAGLSTQNVTGGTTDDDAIASKYYGIERSSLVCRERNRIAFCVISRATTAAAAEQSITPKTRTPAEVLRSIHFQFHHSNSYNHGARKRKPSQPWQRHPAPQNCRKSHRPCCCCHPNCCHNCCPFGTAFGTAQPRKRQPSPHLHNKDGNGSRNGNTNSSTARARTTQPRKRQPSPLFHKDGNGNGY